MIPTFPLEASQGPLFALLNISFFTSIPKKGSNLILSQVPSFPSNLFFLCKDPRALPKNLSSGDLVPPANSSVFRSLSDGDELGLSSTGSGLCPEASSWFPTPMDHSF